MALATEPAYYENPALWAAERYLQSDAELGRLRRCAAVLPAAARTLLDVGSGNGAFLRVLEEVRPELRTTGLERSQTALRMAVCASEIREGSIDAIPHPDRSFDVVTSLEVIEHLPFGVYEAALRELQRVAGRYLLIEVPYREGLVHVHCPRCACSFNPHYHMRQFDDGTMHALFERFRCVRLEKTMTRDVVFSSVVKPVFRKMRDWVGFFPSTCICPQCGFQAAAAADPACPVPDVGHRTRHALRLGRTARRLLPKTERPLAVIGVYERMPD
jgi:SAM-dependent methyltransferase